MSDPVVAFLVVFSVALLFGIYVHLLIVGWLLGEIRDLLKEPDRLKEPKP